MAPHGGPAHDRHIRAVADSAEARSATDIRVNQTQVDASVSRNGANRPDTQFTTESGQRVHYELNNGEIDPDRVDRILDNDPLAVVITDIVGGGG